MSPHQLRHATRILQRGGVLAYPTEGVWGLGCDPLNAAAVYRILAIKQRPVQKGVILIAHRFESLAPYLLPMTAELQQRVFDAWHSAHRPITWVLPAQPSTPVWLTGGRETLAVRVTTHPPTASLCAAWGGALVSTSANVAGRPAARSRQQARAAVGQAVDWVTCGATSGRSRASEIRDARTGQRLRAG